MSKLITKYLDINVFNELIRFLDGLSLQKDLNKNRYKGISDLFIIALKKYVELSENIEQQIKKKKVHTEFYQDRINESLNQLMSIAYLIEKEIPSNVIRKIRGLFRKIIGTYIFQSKMLKRAYEKPRGYPGDYMVFELLYNKKPISYGIGHYLDCWILQHPLTIGTHYRKDKMKKILWTLIEDYSKNKKTHIIDILNIGCGSCREIRELLNKESIRSKQVNFVCCDQDEEPLDFAKNALQKINLNQKIKVKFLKNNIFGMIGLIKKEIYPFNADVIYSMGVVDYLMITTLEFFIKSCYNLLKPNGKLIIPFCSSYDPTIYTHVKWLCDWDFYTFDSSFIKNFIITNLNIKNVEIISEKQKPIFFIIIERK